MLYLLVIITPLKTYLCGQTNFGIAVICLQHLLIECLEKYNFLKIADANSIFPDVKSIMQLSRLHFFANVKWFELERLLLTISSNLSIYNFLKLYSYIHIFSPRKEFPSLWVKKNKYNCLATMILLIYCKLSNSIYCYFVWIKTLFI